MRRQKGRCTKLQLGQAGEGHATWAHVAPDSGTMGTLLSPSEPGLRPSWEGTSAKSRAEASCCSFLPDARSLEKLHSLFLSIARLPRPQDAHTPGLGTVRASDRFT